MIHETVTYVNVVNSSEMCLEGLNMFYRFDLQGLIFTIINLFMKSKTHHDSNADILHLLPTGVPWGWIC